MSPYETAADLALCNSSMKKVPAGNCVPALHAPKLITSDMEAVLYLFHSSAHSTMHPSHCGQTGRGQLKGEARFEA